MVTLKSIYSKESELFMAVFRKNEDPDFEGDSRFSPEEWLNQAEKLAKPTVAIVDLAARNAQLGAAKATIALVYEQKRTNMLLERLLGAAPLKSVCPKCGVDGQEGDFCGSCGASLKDE